MKHPKNHLKSLFVNRYSLFKPLQIVFILFAITFSADIHWYQPEDWVTYRNFRYIRYIHAGRDKVWFGSSGGLLPWDLWQRRWAEPVTTADGLPEEEITAVWKDETGGRLWIKTAGHVYYRYPYQSRWDMESFDRPFDTLSPPPVPDLKGLYLKPPWFFDGTYVKDAALKAYRITAAVRSGQGDFFLGTWGAGAGYGSERMKNAEMKPCGLYSDYTSCVLQDDGKIWFGGSYGNGGITRYRPSRETWEHFYGPGISAFRDNRIYCFSASKRFLWAGSVRGLVKYDKHRNLWESAGSAGLFHTSVLSLCSENDRILWIGTGEGLFRMNPKNEDLVQYINTKDFRILSIFSERAGLWIGTDRGLFLAVPDRTAPKGKKPALMNIKWKPFKKHPYLDYNHIYCLYQADSILWAGTEKGLVRISLKTRNAAEYGGNGTPVTGPVYSICATDKYLWIGTNRGVVQIKPDKEAWNAYSTDDGLIDSRVLAIEKQGDYLWLGTPKGVTRCNWKNIERLKPL